MAIERHYFPGNNTAEGFFSYYNFILNQKEARRILCIKGGPGTGKSTFIRRIGENFINKGEDVDFLHCSSDENSLDGIILKARKIAVIDGTSPHITDPITPGAVDEIINLGDFWNEEGLITEKDNILHFNAECKRWYNYGYNYLDAAGKIFDSLKDIYDRALVKGEIYKLVAETVFNEFSPYEIAVHPGNVKKFFASAITSNGIINYIPSLLTDMKRIYLIDSAIGIDNSIYMQTIVDSAVFRGFDVELFYCPIMPGKKIEHIIIPQTKTAFISTNKYHDILPWEVGGENTKEVILLDMCDYLDYVTLEKDFTLVDKLNEDADALLDEGINCLKNAKKKHDLAESLYIPNMNFVGVNKMCEEIIEKIMTMD